MISPRTILVADDDKELVMAIKTRLQAQGYHVIIAFDGQETVKLVLESEPDLVLLDVLMPVIDGYACLRQINARLGRGKIPVVVLTSRDYMKDLFTLEGIEDYILKPFDSEDLVLRIEQVFKRRANLNPPAAG